MRGHGHLGWGGGVTGVGVPHCKWADDRDDLEPRLKGGKGVGVGVAGVDGNFYIPDHTLAQLTVKELNKRVSQVSQHFFLIAVVLFPFLCV